MTIQKQNKFNHFQITDLLSRSTLYLQMPLTLAIFMPSMSRKHRSTYKSHSRLHFQPLEIKSKIRIKPFQNYRCHSRLQFLCPPYHANTVPSINLVPPANHTHACIIPNYLPWRSSQVKISWNWFLFSGRKII